MHNPFTAMHAFDVSLLRFLFTRQNIVVISHRTLLYQFINVVCLIQGSGDV